MSNFKRILALALTMLMVIGCFTAFASVAAFDDVTEYTDEINALYKLGIIEGKDAEGTTYDPDSNVLRWQMALLISKMMTGKVDNAYVNWYSTENFTPFTDVNQDQFYGSISYANNMGVIIGTSATTFNPEGGITYQDALTMLVRALGYGSGLMDAGYPWSFIDKAIELGLDDGFDDSVNYGSVLTRGQVAKLLYNTLFAQRHNRFLSNDDYTCFAWDVFGFEVYDARVMIVAAEGYKLNSNVKYALGDEIDYYEYDALVDAKKAGYVGFIFVGSWRDEKFVDYNRVYVLPAEEFGLDSVSRTDVGSVYDVVLSDFGYDGEELYGFDRCDRADNFAMFDKSEFTFGTGADGVITGVKVDGQTYYAVNALNYFDYTTDGTRNSAHADDIVIIDTMKNAVVNGTTVEAGDYANLACYDIDGDGKYDIAYYITYRMGAVADEGNAGTYLVCGGYNRLSKNTLFLDLEGNKVNLANGGYYLVQALDGDGANMPKNGSGIAIVRKQYTPTVSGLVTGVDLYKNTITLDGIDAENPGTVYNVGCGTMGGKIGDAALALFTENILYQRVALYIDEELGKVVAITAIPDPAAPAPDRGRAYVFIEDAGRTITTTVECGCPLHENHPCKHPIIKVYDNKANIQYFVVENPEIVATLKKGDLLRLTTAEDGFSNVELFVTRFDPGLDLYDCDLGEGAPVNKYHIMDWINYYWDLRNAVILAWNGNGFEEYAGADLGDGSKISGKVYMERASIDNKICNMTFIYVYDGDVDVAPVTVDSYAKGSIVFINNNVKNYAYTNYDVYGGLNQVDCQITIYNAADMIDGTFKTVTVNGKKGDILPVGFYYIDKNNEITGNANDEITSSIWLHMSKYQTIVSTDAAMTVDAYKKDSLNCVRFQYDGTNTNDWSGSLLDAGAKNSHVNDCGFEAAGITCGMVYSYQGNLYGSDVSVALVTAVGLELVTGEIEAPVLVSADKGTYSFKYEIPKAMYDTVVKDENGYADSAATNFVLSNGAVLPLTTWGAPGTYVYNWAPSFGINPAECGVKFSEIFGHYYMVICEFGTLAHPSWGGFTDDLVEAIQFVVDDVVTYEYDIDFPCYSTFFG